MEIVIWKILNGKQQFRKYQMKKRKIFGKFQKEKKLFGKYQMENNNLENIKCKLIIRKISNEEKTIRKISNKKEEKSRKISNGSSNFETIK